MPTSTDFPIPTQSQLRTLQGESYTINPLKSTRVFLGLSQAKLAVLAKVSPGAILKYEQGLYQEPSHKILRTLQAVGEDLDYIVDLNKITEEYHHWRLLHQASQRWLFEDIRTLAWNENTHPFRILRHTVGSGYSLQGFAVLLAVHPSTLQTYDNSKIKWMPSVIKSALLTAGCREHLIKEIDSKGARYYGKRRAED
jgi:transcriptional regulator with XRE-family HTH domain